MIEVETPTGDILEFPDGTPEAEMQAATRRYLQMQPVDRDTGAPALARMLVGGSTDQPSRLATLQQFYPDAAPDPDDPENFIYTNPETGIRTAYNPSGMDPGDIASLAREIYQGAGGAMGGAAGLLVGAPSGPGALATAAGGAGMGTLAGEGLFQATARMMGMQDLRPLSQATTEAALIGGAGLTGVPGGAVMGQTARETVKSVVRGSGDRRFMQEAVREAQQLGIDPTLSVSLHRTMWDEIEQHLAKVPGARGFLLRKAQDANETVGNFVRDRTIEMAGRANVDATIAGRAVQRGAEEFSDTFRAKGRELYDAVDRAIPSGTPIRLDKSRETLGQLADLAPDFPAISDTLSNPRIRQLYQNVEASLAESGGEIPYELARQLRSAVGTSINNASLMDDIPTSQLKQVYGALSQDIMGAARGVSETAYNRARRADTYWKAGRERIDGMLQGLMKKDPEQVFQALQTSGKRGATRLRTIRNSVNDNQWNLLRGEVFRRFGRVAPGQQDAGGDVFSMNTFLTNWNQLDDSARDLLLSNDQGFKEAMETVASYSAKVRDASQLFANPSGTAQGALGGFATMTTLGAPFAALTGSASLGLPAMVAGGTISARGMAGLMQNPNFVKWLASSTEVNPAGWGAHVGLLANIAGTGTLEQDEALGQYADSLQNILGQNLISQDPGSRNVTIPIPPP